jgi:hypothetical protein
LLARLPRRGAGLDVRGAGRLIFLYASTAPHNHEFQSAKEDAKVIGEGLVLDVVEAELIFFGAEFFDEDAMGIVVADQLAQIVEAHGGFVGDAGADAEDLALLGSVGGGVLFELGARADEGHITHDDIDELRELVDLIFSKKTADFGDARIVGASGAAELVSVEVHGAEFPDAEWSAVQASTQGAVEGGAGGVEADEDDEEEEDRGEEEEAESGADEVEDALYHFRRTALSTDALAGYLETSLRPKQ